MSLNGLVFIILHSTKQRPTASTRPYLVAYCYIRFFIGKSEIKRVTDKESIFFVIFARKSSVLQDGRYDHRQSRRARDPAQAYRIGVVGADSYLRSAPSRQDLFGASVFQRCIRFLFYGDLSGHQKGATRGIQPAVGILFGTQMEGREGLVRGIRPTA